MNVVLARRGTHELEHFAEMQGVVTANLDGAGDENEHGVGVVGWLNVHGLDRVLDGADGLVLGNDGRTALDLVALKGQHGAVLLWCRGKDCRNEKIEHEIAIQVPAYKPSHKMYHS